MLPLFSTLVTEPDRSTIPATEPPTPPEPLRLALMVWLLVMLVTPAPGSIRIPVTVTGTGAGTAGVEPLAGVTVVAELIWIEVAVIDPSLTSAARFPPDRM